MTFWISKSNMHRFSSMQCFLWFAGILMALGCAANLQQVLKFSSIFLCVLGMCCFGKFGQFG
jgi:hypothetical protein